MSSPIELLTRIRLIKIKMEADGVFDREQGLAMRSEDMDEALQLPLFGGVNPALVKAMLKLMDRLDAIQCRVILMSPSMYDLQAFEKRVAANPKLAAGRDTANYNGVLAYYGKWLQETARKRGYPFVDLYGPMNTHTNQQRKLNPEFTFIPDAVHPAEDGQFVMAYELLKQTGETGVIFSSGVRLVNGQWQPISPALVKDITGEPGRTASYTVLPKCLPWVVPDSAAAGFKLTRAGHAGSQEAHVAVGLAAGRYDLILNNQVVGIFDERALSVHAEVEEDPDSPTRQQALKVALLNEKRNNEAVHPLRDLYRDRKIKLRAAQAAKDLKPFETWWTTEGKAKEAELVKKAGEIEDEIYKANQVSPLKVEIKPTTTPLPARPQPRKAVVKKAA